MNLLPISLLAALLLGSCALSTDVDLKMPLQAKYYVVDGVIRLNSPFELSVQESARMNESMHLTMVNNADVRVVYRTDTFPLLSFLYLRPTDRIAINYSSKRYPKMSAGDSLRLIVRKDSVTLTAADVVPNSFEVSRCRIENGQVVVAVIDSDPPENQLYSLNARFFTTANSFKMVSNIYRGDKDFTAEGCMTLKMPFQTYLSADVTITKITPDYYRYLYSIGKAFDAYYDPFTIPTAVSSNIRGGIGIFTVVDEKVVTL